MIFSSNQFEIENFAPQLLHEYGNQILISNENASEKYFDADLTVTPRTNQFLDIRIENITIRNSGYDRCYFKEEPQIISRGMWLERFDPKQIDVTIEAFVTMTYEPYGAFYSSNSTDLSKHEVGFVDYIVNYIDVQNKKSYNTIIPAQLVVEIPTEFTEPSQRCLVRYK